MAGRWVVEAGSDSGCVDSSTSMQYATIVTYCTSEMDNVLLVYQENSISAVTGNLVCSYTVCQLRGLIVIQGVSV